MQLPYSPHYRSSEQGTTTPTCTRPCFYRAAVFMVLDPHWLIQLPILGVTLLSPAKKMNSTLAKPWTGIWLKKTQSRQLDVTDCRRVFIHALKPFMYLSHLLPILSVSSPSVHIIHATSPFAFCVLKNGP